MIRERQYIQTTEGLKAFAEQLADMNLPEHGIIIEVKMGKRTTAQNNAMHKYFTMLADALNDAGLDQVKTLKPGTEIPWEPSSVKKILWGSIMQAVTKKTRTRDLDIDEISKVYDVLNRHIAEKFGVMVMFPSKDTM